MKYENEMHGTICVSQLLCSPDGFIRCGNINGAAKTNQTVV